MSGHGRRLKVAAEAAAASIPGEFPKILERADYSIVNIKDDGWCLYNAFLKRFKLDGPENALKLAHIVADRFRDEMAKTTDFNYFDNVVGNPVYAANDNIIDGITGIASQDPAKPRDPYIMVNGVNRAVIFENTFIDSITRLRVPNKIEYGPIAYPESQGFFIILNDLFKNIRPVFYQKGDTGESLNLQGLLTTLNSPPKDNTVYVFIKYNGTNHFDFIQPTTSGSLNWSLKADTGSRLLTQDRLNTAYEAAYASLNPQSASSGSNSSSASSGSNSSSSSASILPEAPQTENESSSASNSSSASVLPEAPQTENESSSASSPAVKTDPWIFYKLLLRATKKEETDINALLAACAIASHMRDKNVTNLDRDYFYSYIPFSTITSPQIIAGLATPIDRYNLALGPVFRPTDIRGIELGLTALYPHVTFKQGSTIIKKNQHVYVTFNDELTNITETFGVLPNMLEDPRCRYDPDKGLDMLNSGGGEFEKVFGPPPTIFGFRTADTVTNKRLVAIAERIYKPGKSVATIPVGSSSAASVLSIAVPKEETAPRSQSPGSTVELPEISRTETPVDVTTATGVSSQLPRPNEGLTGLPGTDIPLNVTTATAAVPELSELSGRETSLNIREESESKQSYQPRDELGDELLPISGSNSASSSSSSAGLGSRLSLLSESLPGRSSSYSPLESVPIPLSFSMTTPREEGGRSSYAAEATSPRRLLVGSTRGEADTGESLTGEFLTGEFLTARALAGRAPVDITLAGSTPTGTWADFFRNLAATPPAGGPPTGGPRGAPPSVMNHIREHVAEIAAAAAAGINPAHLEPPPGDDPDAADFGDEDF